MSKHTFLTWLYRNMKPYTWRPTEPAVPYNKSHATFKLGMPNRRLFERWYARPSKAHLLYWRLHRSEHGERPSGGI
jgi:hypothetical protein